MERFDDSIKRDFVEHNTPSEIEAALDTLHKLKLAECDGLALSPVSKIPAQVFILLQVGLRRTIELSEAAIREINRRNLVTAALLSRGTLETSCLLWDVMRQIESVVEKGDTANIMGLLEILSKSLLGGKAKDVMIDDSIVARNVITIIDRLSRKLSVPLDGFYAQLSEFAHPNYHGMMSTYTVEGGGDTAVKVFCDRRASSERMLILTAVGAVVTSCSIVIESFKIAAAKLEAMAILAEKEIYESGRWPKDEPYPVNRG
jgi:hypothetical protein